MATISKLSKELIGTKTPKLYNRIRTTIESVFYGNNVVPVRTMKEAYELAKNSPGTIVTDMPVERAGELGLPEDAKVLLFNDGKITGRQAKLRRLVDDNNREYFGA